MRPAPHTWPDFTARCLTGFISYGSTSSNDQGNLTSDLCDVQIPMLERAQAPSTNVHSPQLPPDGQPLTQNVQPDEDDTTRVALRASSTGVYSRTHTSQDKINQPVTLTGLSHYNSNTSDSDTSDEVDSRSVQRFCASTAQSTAVASRPYLESETDKVQSIQPSRCTRSERALV